MSSPGQPFDGHGLHLRVRRIVIRGERTEIARRAAAVRADADRRARQAERPWAEAGPIAGTPAEAHLRGRGITCALPPGLRFHGAAWHAPSVRRLPALAEGGAGVALHRTFVRPDGAGKAELPPGTPAKMALGPTAGGAVRLTEGPGRLVVAEGLETALGLGCGLLDGPAAIWAALSTSGLRGLHLPPRPGRLTLAPDGHAPVPSTAP